jgi:hypothetical protein
MVEVPVLGFWKYWAQELTSLKPGCHIIMNKHPEEAPLMQLAYEVLSDTDNFATSTSAKMRECCEGTSIVNSMGKRTNFCKSLYGKPHFSTFYGTCHNRKFREKIYLYDGNNKNGCKGSVTTSFASASGIC